MWLTACNGGYFFPPGNNSMKTFFLYLAKLPAISQPKDKLTRGGPSVKVKSPAHVTISLLFWKMSQRSSSGTKIDSSCL